jgi:hypothetical protein
MNRQRPVSGTCSRLWRELIGDFILTLDKGRTEQSSRHLQRAELHPFSPVDPSAASPVGGFWGSVLGLGLRIAYTYRSLVSSSEILWSKKFSFWMPVLRILRVSKL